MKTQTLKILKEILENALLDQLDMRHELDAKFISEVRKAKLTTELKKTEQFIDTVKKSIEWVSSAREPIDSVQSEQLPPLSDQDEYQIFENVIKDHCGNCQ